MDPVEVKYKTNFYSKEKTLVFSEGSLSLYCNSRLLTKIDKKEICGFRYGTKWIRFEFPIGRTYCIDITDGKNKLVKVRLRSLFLVNKQKLTKKFSGLVDTLYSFYFNEKISNYVSEINDGTNVEIANIVFKKEGVCLDLQKSDGLVEWDDLNSRAYTYYYTLSSKKKPDFYKAFTYLTDWNAVIVYSVSRQILVSKGLLNIS